MRRYLDGEVVGFSELGSMRSSALCWAWSSDVGAWCAGCAVMEEEEIGDLLDVLDIEDARLAHPSSELTRKS